MTSDSQARGNKFGTSLLQRPVQPEPLLNAFPAPGVRLSRSLAGSDAVLKVKTFISFFFIFN